MTDKPTDITFDPKNCVALGCPKCGMQPLRILVQLQVGSVVGVCNSCEGICVDLKLHRDALLWAINVKLGQSESRIVKPKIVPGKVH